MNTAVEEALRERLSAHLAGFATNHMCFGCKQSEAAACRVGIEILDARDGSCKATVRFPKTTEGAPGFVHGGYVAMALDELSAVASSSAGFGVLTGSLDVRYLRPVVLGAPMEGRAVVSVVQGNRATIESALQDPTTGAAAATAAGVFVQTSERILTGLVAALRKAQSISQSSTGASGRSSAPGREVSE